MTTPKYNSNFGRTLHLYLDTVGLTVRELAELVGYSESHVIKLVHGKSTPSPEFVIHLCKATSADEHWRKAFHIAGAKDTGWLI